MRVRSYKSKLIVKYGTNVETHRFLEDGEVEVQETKALLGRGSRNNTNMRQLESQKEGIFLPTFDIRGGDFVINPNHDESYVVSGIHKEYDGNSLLSYVCNLWKCNSKITVKGHTRKADDRGNLKSFFGDKYTDVPTYLEEVTNELRQYEPGIHPDSEYRIYTTSLVVDHADQVVVNVLGKQETFKVIATDYITFPHMLVIDVNRDIRK